MNTFFISSKSKFRNHLSKAVFSCICFCVFAPLSLIAQANESWHTTPETIDRLSKLRPQDNYVESKIPFYTLPDVLTTTKGVRITDTADWEKYRRPEILDMFASQVYGRVPATKYKQSMKVIKEDKNAMHGAATLKLVDITITARSKSLTIHLGLFVPNKVQKPAPIFLLICNRPPENINFLRTQKNRFWPAEAIVERGYAVAAFDIADVDPDVDDNFVNGIHGLFDKTRTPESWASIAAWAWGTSRCIDYFVTDKDIAHDKIAVVGHSRGGKTAIWAGATDTRIALVVSNDAGRGGTSLARRRYGETVEMINDVFPHWFCENFRKYNNKEDALPVDWHMLMACVAPRALYVASADKDLVSDPHGQYLAMLQSLPAYQLYSAKNTLSIDMPPLEKPVYGGQLAYHIRTGEHDLLPKDWNYFMDYADIIFKGKK